MRRERIFLILGIWVALLPYLGFPYSWKNMLFTLSGLVLVYYSYIIYTENKEKDKTKESFDNFNEMTETYDKDTDPHDQNSLN